MPPRYYHRPLGNDGGDLEEISDHFRLYALDVSMSAEQGTVQASTVRAVDVDGVLDVGGLRRFVITEEHALTPFRHIGHFYTGSREEVRGESDRVGPSRDILIELQSANTILDRRIMVGSDCNRPAEDSDTRLRWLMDSTENSLLIDERYLNLGHSEGMDKADYRGQSFRQVLDDISQATGFDYFVIYFEDTGVFGLWFDDPGSAEYSSTLRLSNYLEDVEGDPTSTFAIAQGDDSKHKIDPHRVYSGVYLPYTKGYVYEQNNVTADLFARRDTAMPSENVKSAAAARRRARRYLAREVASEEHTVTTWFLVPNAKVNYLREGMRVQFRASHFTGLTEWTWMRVMDRKVFQESEDFYKISVTLTTDVPVGALVGGVYGHLGFARMKPGDGFGNQVSWARWGDEPGNGHPDTVGPISPIEGGYFDRGDDTGWVGWLVGGDGTVDIRFVASWIGVRNFAKSYTVTASILVNGVIVASEVTTYGATGSGLASQADVVSVEATGVVVADGDAITAQVTCTPEYLAFFKVPAGAGQQSESLVITGGSLS